MLRAVGVACLVAYASGEAVTLTGKNFDKKVSRLLARSTRAHDRSTMKLRRCTTKTVRPSSSSRLHVCRIAFHEPDAVAGVIAVALWFAVRDSPRERLTLKTVRQLVCRVIRVRPLQKDET